MESQSPMKNSAVIHLPNVYFFRTREGIIIRVHTVSIDCGTVPGDLLA